MLLLSRQVLGGIIGSSQEMEGCIFGWDEMKRCLEQRNTISWNRRAYEERLLNSILASCRGSTRSKTRTTPTHHAEPSS